jgi:hypothetical protein
MKPRDLVRRIYTVWTVLSQIDPAPGIRKGACHEISPLSDALTKRGRPDRRRRRPARRITAARSAASPAALQKLQKSDRRGFATQKRQFGDTRSRGSPEPAGDSASGDCQATDFFASLRFVTVL